MKRTVRALTLVLALMGCGSSDGAVEDAGVDAAPQTDASTITRDASDSTPDASPADAATPDATILDSGISDAEIADIAINDASPPDAGPVDAGPPELTLQYVVNAISVPLPTTTPMPGFDLDGFNATGGTTIGCSQSDYIGIGGATGIDNAIPGLRAALWDTVFVTADSFDNHVTDALRGADTVLLLEILGATSLNDDAEVRVTFHQGTFVPSGDAGTAPTLDGMNRMVAGQRFVISTTLATSTGSISGGVLTSQGDVMGLILPYEESQMDYFFFPVLRDGRLEVNLGAGDLLEDVNVGGAIPRRELEGHFMAGTASRDAIEIAAPGILDHTDGETACSALSAGVTFSAVRADLVVP